jgi:hypothetical protein
MQVQLVAGNRALSEDINSRGGVGFLVFVEQLKPILKKIKHHASQIQKKK